MDISNKLIENRIKEKDIEVKEDSKFSRLIESSFGSIARTFMRAANPFKKFAFKTPCLMHRFINIQAIHILENEGYTKEADFFRKYIKTINEGATWIDQDFKSTNHFYHFEEKDGLYGFSNAYLEAEKYREKLNNYIKINNITRSLFYLGVILHLTQDMTVPQHVNNKLLESHRDYEQWILKNAWDEVDYKVKSGIIRYPSLKTYFDENATETMRVYKELNAEKEKEKVYEQMSLILVARAQKATAGILLDFYEKVYKEKDKSTN